MGFQINAQYISSIKFPDTNKAIVTDENDPSVKAANSITAAEMKELLTVLASDEFEGRETGYPGNERAAQFINEYYNDLNTSKIGEDNSHFQNVQFHWNSWTETQLVVNQSAYRHLWDYLAFPTRNEAMGPLQTNEIIFLGYGLQDTKYDDYRKAKINNKVVMIYEGLPGGVDLDQEWDIQKKLSLAKAKGAKFVLVIANNIKDLLGKNRRLLLGPSIKLGKANTQPLNEANHIYISAEVAEKLWGKSKKKIIKARDKALKNKKPKAVKFKTFLSVNNAKNAKELKGKNVLGYVEGSDKKDEVIVVSAHYDHIGKKGDDVYNGADDNASGTSAVMEMAEAFVQAKKDGHGPRRSILFLHVTGEEKGLLGSKYYAENPIFPLANTVANVNVDMIGRVDQTYKDNPNYIYVIGSDRLSTDLHRINENMNATYSQLILDYTYNSESDPNRYYFRSDHYNFAEKGIPAIFYFSGVHEDYHMSTDTAEKILFDKMENVARMIFHTTWELANRDQRILVDGKP